MREFAQLEKDSLDYLGPIDLPQYYVDSYKISNTIEISRGKFAMEVHLVLGRRIRNQLLTNFLPTILIIIVSFATNFFQVSRIAKKRKFLLNCLGVLRTRTLMQQWLSI